MTVHFSLRGSNPSDFVKPIFSYLMKPHILPFVMNFFFFAFHVLQLNLWISLNDHTIISSGYFFSSFFVEVDLSRKSSLKISHSNLIILSSCFILGYIFIKEFYFFISLSLPCCLYWM